MIKVQFLDYVPASYHHARIRNRESLVDCPDR